MTEKSPNSTITNTEIEEWIEEEEDEVTLSTFEVLDDSYFKNKYQESQLKIMRSSMDWPLEYLIQVLKGSSQLNLNPDYQRRSRWDNRKKSLLIESLLLNIPIPPIYLYENEYNQYEVMDGLQRVTAVSDYFDDKFPLRGLDTWHELNGKKYSQLPNVIRLGLNRRNITSIILLAETRSIAGTDEPIDVRKALFERLNTGGEPLNPQEIRNALYNSKFNQILHEISRDRVFCKIWMIPWELTESQSMLKQLHKNALYKSMLDLEIALRVFAIRESIQIGKGGSMRLILDSCMARHLKTTEEQAEILKNEYLSCLNRWFGIFEEDTFINIRTGKPSRPLYDALMVALINNQGEDIESRKETIKYIVSELMFNDEYYEILVGRANTFDSIKERVEIATQIIRNNLSKEVAAIIHKGEAH